MIDHVGLVLRRSRFSYLVIYVVLYTVSYWLCPPAITESSVELTYLAVLHRSRKRCPIQGGSSRGQRFRLPGRTPQRPPSGPDRNSSTSLVYPAKRTERPHSTDRLQGMFFKFGGSFATRDWISPNLSYSFGLGGRGMLAIGGREVLMITTTVSSGKSSTNHPGLTSWWAVVRIRKVMADVSVWTSTMCRKAIVWHSHLRLMYLSTPRHLSHHSRTVQSSLHAGSQ